MSGALRISFVSSSRDNGSLRASGRSTLWASGSPINVTSGTSNEGANVSTRCLRFGMEWYKVVGWILYYITLPVVWILLLLLNIVRFILSPFIYIAYLLKEVCAWPFRFLAKFEVFAISTCNCMQILMPPASMVFRRERRPHRHPSCPVYSRSGAIVHRRL